MIRKELYGQFFSPNNVCDSMFNSSCDLLVYNKGSLRQTVDPPDADSAPACTTSAALQKRPDNLVDEPIGRQRGRSTHERAWKAGERVWPAQPVKGKSF
jgi:hypothetical protein